MDKNKTNSSVPFEENEYSFFAELILHDSLLEYRRDKLRRKIDMTLKERNKEEFLRLTEELKKIS